MSNKMKNYIGLGIGLFGLWLVVVYGNWLLALGLFLTMWGNNIQFIKNNET